MNKETSFSQTTSSCFSRRMSRHSQASGDIVCPSRTCLKHLASEASRRPLYQVPESPQLFFSMWKSSLSWITDLLTLCLREGPATLQIHFLPLIHSQVAEATGPRKKPRHPSPQRHFPACPGESKAFPNQRGCISPPTSPLTSLGPPISGTCLEHL